MDTAHECAVGGKFEIRINTEEFNLYLYAQLYIIDNEKLF